MRTFLKVLILLPLGILLVLLAVANRAPVSLSLDPVARSPDLAVTLPLCVVIFAALTLGILIGGIAAWQAQAKHRKAARRYRREASHLRSDAERLRTRSASTALAPLPSANRAGL